MSTGHNLCGSHATDDTVATFAVIGDPTCKLPPGHVGDHLGGGYSWWNQGDPACYKGMTADEIERVFDLSRGKSEGPLRNLLAADEASQHERNRRARWTFTEKQRVVVSAYRSAQLRAKVAAGIAADRARQVTVLCDSGETDE